MRRVRGGSLRTWKSPTPLALFSEELAPRGLHGQGERVKETRQRSLCQLMMIQRRVLAGKKGKCLAKARFCEAHPLLCRP